MDRNTNMISLCGVTVGYLDISFFTGLTNSKLKYTWESSKWIPIHLPIPSTENSVPHKEHFAKLILEVTLVETIYQGQEIFTIFAVHRKPADVSAENMQNISDNFQKVHKTLGMLVTTAAH